MSIPYNVIGQQRLEYASEQLNSHLKEPDLLEIYNNVKNKSLDGKVLGYIINKELLTQSELSISIENRYVEFSLEELDLRGENDFSWHGQSKDGKGFVVFVFLNGMVSGNVLYEGKSYNFSPLKKSNMTLFYEIDPQGYPDDHPKVIDKRINSYINREPHSQIESMTPNSVNNSVRLLIAFTPSAEAGAASLGYSDMKLFLQQSVSETNQSFINSNVNHRVKLASGLRVSYTESGDFSTDLFFFMSTLDPYMNEVHTYRNQYSADVCVLLINNPTACGVASGIGSTQNSAFAAVHYSCAIGYYSLAHEIGHLHGCRHNPEVDPNTSPYPYGHGYYNAQNNWRTIMSYDCPGGCVRLPYWSNPDVLFGGIPMGTAHTHDNARVLNATSSTIANYRTAPSNLNLGSNSNIDYNEIGEAIAFSTITMSSGFSVALGGEFYAKAGSSIDASMLALDEINEDNSVGLTNNSLFQIYPNPNLGSFNISINNQDSKEAEIIIFDNYGNEVYKNTQYGNGEYRINLPVNKSGIYYLRLQNQEKSETKRVLIEK